MTAFLLVVFKAVFEHSLPSKAHIFVQIIGVNVKAEPVKVNEGGEVKG